MTKTSVALFCRAADGAPPAGGRHPAAGRGRLHAAASRRAGRQQRDSQVPHRQRWVTLLPLRDTQLERATASTRF